MSQSQDQNTSNLTLNIEFLTILLGYIRYATLNPRALISMYLKETMLDVLLQPQKQWLSLIGSCGPESKVPKPQVTQRLETYFMGSLCKLAVPAVSAKICTDFIVLALALPTSVPAQLFTGMSILYKLIHIIANSAMLNHLYMKDLALHFQFVLRTILESIAVPRPPNTCKTPKLPPVLHFYILSQPLKDRKEIGFQEEEFNNYVNKK